MKGNIKLKKKKSFYAAWGGKEADKEKMWCKQSNWTDDEAEKVKEFSSKSVIQKLKIFVPLQMANSDEMLQHKKI